MVTFKDVELQLDEHPLVIVSGRNLDSEARDNKNGVGKSVLLGTLPNLRYEADPMALTKRAKKAMVEKDSLIEYEWEHNGKTIIAAQTSTKYHITIDGEDLEVHKGKQEVGRQHIERMFPMSETAFYTYAYLHSQRSNMFQYAKPAERMAYIIDMHDMHIYDKLRAYFATKATEARKQAQEAEVISGELQVAQAKLTSVAVDPSKVDRAQRLYDAAAQELSDCLEQLNALRVESANSAQKQKLRSRIRDLGIKCDDPAAELEHIEQLYDDVRAYAEYQSRLAEYQEERAALERDIADLNVPDQDLDECAARLAEVEDELNKLVDEIDDDDERLAELDDLRAELDDLRADPMDVPDCTEDECLDGISMCKATLNLAAEFEDQIAAGKSSCKCPTCSSRVDVKSLALAVKRAKADLKKFESFRAYFKRQAAIEEIESHISDLSTSKIDRKAILRKGKALERERTKLSALVQSLREASRLRRHLDSLRAPKKVSEPDTDMSLEEIRARGKDLTLYIELKTQYSKLPTCRSASSLKELILGLESESKELTAKTKKLNDRYTELNYKLMSFTDAKETVERLEQRLEKLRPAVAKLKLYELMQKAYASTNLKASAVEGVLLMIESELNALHALTFPEPMEFTLRVKNGGVEALVTRKSSGRTSDLSKLSGAESNCFSLLWAYVMLVFTPAEKRPSFIVLDEPDHLCSPGLREHLIREFLPKLMDIVPHVFWITPQDPELFGDAHRWIVEKKNGYSQVLEE